VVQKEAIFDGVERALRKRPVALEPVQGGGYSLALRLKAAFSDGTTAFVKAATTDNTARFLRQEKHVYEALGPQPFLAAFLGFDDAGDFPLLVLEDLSGAFWPPPWTPDRINAVLAALEQVRKTPVPELSPLEAERKTLSQWTTVAVDSAPFLSLGLCDAAWLEASLPRLLDAEKALDLSGDSLLHLDVRSDNLCFRADGSAVLVDWNWACVGPGIADTALWAPSLRSEGGPLPETLVPDSGPWAAALSGYFASTAGLPPPEGAPRVREVQLSQLKSCLPWATRALGLPLPF
jgi:hypothetical protein